MKFSEPTFETGGDLWPAPSNVPDVEAHALEEKLAQKSAELRLRLTEVLAFDALLMSERETAEREIRRAAEGVRAGG